MRSSNFEYPYDKTIRAMYANLKCSRVRVHTKYLLQTRRTQYNLLFGCIIMNYNNCIQYTRIRTVSLEKRARVGSCQRAIIVFECNNFTQKNI